MKVTDVALVHTYAYHCNHPGEALIQVRVDHTTTYGDVMAELADEFCTLGNGPDEEQFLAALRTCFEAADLKERFNPHVRGRRVEWFLLSWRVESTD